MKITPKMIKQFNTIAREQRFVFTEADLMVLFDKNLDQSFYRFYKKLNDLDMINRFCRGIYVANGFSLIDVNSKLNENTYISFEYVLAKHSLIGSYSDREIRSIIKKGRTRSFKFQNYKITQYKISENLFFGFTQINGNNIATPEKAYLDCLYFYTKGMRFSFDIFSDVDISLLNIAVIKKFLSKYKNKKFQTFVKGVLLNAKK